MDLFATMNAIFSKMIEEIERNQYQSDFLQDFTEVFTSISNCDSQQARRRRFPRLRPLLTSNCHIPHYRLSAARRRNSMAGQKPAFAVGDRPA
jgi:hypothetical protein